MRNEYLRTGASALALIVGATFAQAQDFYAGAGFEFADGTLNFESNEFDATYVFLGGTVDIGGGFFAGGEFETSLNADSSAVGIVGQITSYQRIRAILGKDLGSLRVFGSFGRMNAEYALSDSFEGQTYGIGLDAGITDTMTLRLEAIRDDSVDSNGYEWDNSSVRAAAIYKF